MFSKKKQQPIKSVIAQGCRIEGNLSFVEGLHIDGEVLGDIRAMEGQSSLLVISETARIQGAIYSDHLVVNGHVHGPIYARELLELLPKACVTGDVHYKALEMHQGATISGMLCPTNVIEAAPLLKLSAE